MLHMSAQCYEHQFGYCTNAKTCFNVHFQPILAERRVLLGDSLPDNEIVASVISGWLSLIPMTHSTDITSLKALSSVHGVLD